MDFLGNFPHTVLGDICSKQKNRVNFWREKPHPNKKFLFFFFCNFFGALYDLVRLYDFLLGSMMLAENHYINSVKLFHQEQTWTFSLAFCICRHRPIFNSFVPLKSSACYEGTSPTTHGSLTL